MWEDNWVSSLLGFKPIAWQPVLNQQLRVSDLIDDELGKWKVNVIQVTFMESDAQHVLSIPLFRAMPEDKLIWHHEKEGEYSVKTTYQILCKQNLNQSPGSSNGTNCSRWRKLWKAHIHEKTKNFMWRLLKNILPTKYNLRNKGINADISCPFCHAFTETSTHLFVECELSKRFFFFSSFGH